MEPTENSQMENSQMENSQMENSQMENSQMENSQVENCQMENSQVENSQVENCQMENCHVVDFKVGDIVARKSYGCDVFFKIVDIQQSEDGSNLITLKGIIYRLEADAPGNDLEAQAQPEQKLNEYRDKCCMLAEQDYGVTTP